MTDVLELHITHADKEIHFCKVCGKKLVGELPYWSGYWALCDDGCRMPPPL